LTGEEILTEYKTQSSVEKKFQQLKSPHFVNSLYLDTPERIEALTYMILISMMILSIAEHVVRRELKATGEKIIGPERNVFIYCKVSTNKQKERGENSENNNESNSSE
jgi:transposase